MSYQTAASEYRSDDLYRIDRLVNVKNKTNTEKKQYSKLSNQVAGKVCIEQTYQPMKFGGHGPWVYYDVYRVSLACLEHLINACT
jgi:hypothetical protein